MPCTGVGGDGEVTVCITSFVLQFTMSWTNSWLPSNTCEYTSMCLITGHHKTPCISHTHTDMLRVSICLAQTRLKVREKCRPETSCCFRLHCDGVTVN